MLLVRLDASSGAPWYVSGLAGSETSTRRPASKGHQAAIFLSIKTGSQSVTRRALAALNRQPVGWVTPDARTRQ